MTAKIGINLQAVLVLFLLCVYPGQKGIVFAEGQSHAADPRLERLLEKYNKQSNANARYLAFAQKAADEGYGAVASLYRATAMAEQVHFEQDAVEITKLGGVPKATIVLPPIGTTEENLKTSVAGETREKEAQNKVLSDKKQRGEEITALDSITMAVINNHLAWYMKASKELGGWKDPVGHPFFVCPVCGNIVTIPPKDHCSICGKGEGAKFIPVK